MYAAAFPRVIECPELDSKMDVTKVEEAESGREACSDSALATPRERNSWEDVVSTASDEAKPSMRVE